VPRRDPGVPVRAVGAVVRRRLGGGSGVTDYDEYRSGTFRAPRGPGRCDWCGFHKPTQGHREGCPQQKESK
jgi:hypothetical protein